jgi:hypothetical protein
MVTKLLLQFLDKAKLFNAEVEPIKVLKTNTFKIDKAYILIRTASDLGKRYFFGLNYINAEEIYNLDNSFIAFICGNINQTVFIPSDTLIKHLPQISHDRNGEYKINFTRDLNLVLKGKRNLLDCSGYVNNWDSVLSSQNLKTNSLNPDESFHNVLQGRLLEIGNIRNYKTYSPDKSRTFNKKKLIEIATLNMCPQLQFTEYNSVRNIDVIWFREVNNGYYPEYAFEVELSTGVWSGFGRLASLREYNTRLYIITNDDKKFNQVANSFPDLKNRCIHFVPDKVGLLYSAEINLIRMRMDFNL